MSVQVQLEHVAQRWFVRPESRPQAEVRLFCLPYAGSGAAVYRPWLMHLPTTIELHVVQLPGRETRLREQPYRRMQLLIEALAPAIEQLLDRPYILFGHSMGALIAFELTRALRRRGGSQPDCLLVSGRRGPQLADPDSPLHQLSDAQFVRAMVQRYNGIPRVILEDIELLRLFLPTLRADLELIETYRYSDEPPLECPIAAFGGHSDERASLAELEAWLNHSSRPFSARQFPGGHFYLQEERAKLIASIVETFGAVSGRSSG